MLFIAWIVPDILPVSRAITHDDTSFIYQKDDVAIVEK